MADIKQKYDVQRGCYVVKNSLGQPCVRYDQGCCKRSVFDWLKGLPDETLKNLFEVNGNLEVNVEESNLLKGNNQILLKEMFFKDGDLFYEVAKQRKLVFIDTSQEKGAQTYYKGEIPEEKKDPANPSRAKINPVFSRLPPPKNISIYKSNIHFHPS